MNKRTALELVTFVIESMLLIKARSQNIKSADDFLSDDTNIMKMEAIMMRLQASGEAIKNLDKRDKTFLTQVAPSDYWRKIIRFRDLISHHYIDIQADEIFNICETKVSELEENMKKLKEILENEIK